jgi:hypothetical protein
LFACLLRRLPAGNYWDVPRGLAALLTLALALALALWLFVWGWSGWSGGNDVDTVSR